MDAGNEVGCDEFPNHICRQLCSITLHCSVVGLPRLAAVQCCAHLYRFQVEEDGVGNSAFGEINETAERRKVLDRHDPRQNRQVDAYNQLSFQLLRPTFPSNGPNPFLEPLDIVKQLS